MCEMVFYLCACALARMKVCLHLKRCCSEGLYRFRLNGWEWQHWVKRIFKVVLFDTYLGFRLSSCIKCLEKIPPQFKILCGADCSAISRAVSIMVVIALWMVLPYVLSCQRLLNNTSHKTSSQTSIVSSASKSIQAANNLSFRKLSKILQHRECLAMNKLTALSWYSRRPFAIYRMCTTLYYINQHSIFNQCGMTSDTSES